MCDYCFLLAILPGYLFWLCLLLYFHLNDRKEKNRGRVEDQIWYIVEHSGGWSGGGVGGGVGRMRLI